MEIPSKPHTPVWFRRETLARPKSNSKEILGFYRESNTNVGTGVFVPIGRHLEDFSPEAIVGAREIINEAISANDEAVHSLKKWGSIGNLIDQVLAHNWATGSSKL